MKEFRFVSFKNDLLKTVTAENSKSYTLFILPSFASKNKLQRLFQENYGIQNVTFFTMDEFKENSFITPFPVLKEDKRNLALYSLLSQKDKNYFHIKDYFDSITFAHNFFDFYEELNEEFISDKEIYKVFEESFSDVENQIETYKRIEKIKNQYQNYLNKNRLNDKIFLYKPNYKVEEKKNHKVVVINQFYFTKLEKYLLDSFNQSLYYMQLPQDLYDKESMTLKDKFGATHLKNIASKNISLSVLKDYVHMNIALMKEISKYNKATIVDFEFKNNPRFSFLNKNLFFTESDNFTSISIYGFLQKIEDILSSFKKGMISLKSFSQAWQSPNFRSFFPTDDNEEVLLNIYKKNKDNYRYFDKYLISGSPFDEIFVLLNVLTNITDINDFIRLFKEKLLPNTILTEKEKIYSNATEIFYQALYDIKSIASLPNIDWEIILNGKLPAIFFIKLLLNHLKAKKVRWNIENFEKKYRITSLLDTRNLSFEKIFITHITNGKLPSPQRVRFLFTENQREKLGLLTHNKIRLREKYYLYRLIASSKEIFLFSISDIEENIEVSSFIEELIHDIPDKMIIQNSNANEKFSYINLYNHLLITSNYNVPNAHKIFNNPDFFRFNKNQFKTLSLSPSKFLMIKNAPFISYLKYFLKVPEIETDFPDDFRGNFLGQFVHTIFATLFHRIADVYKFGKINEHLLFNKIDYIKKSYNYAILSDKSFKYKLTYTQADKYFKTFYKSFVIDSIDTFVTICYEILKEANKIKFIPEDEKRAHNYKPLGKISDVDVEITGISDLRIETASQNYIVDFKIASKTKHSTYKEQLKFYEFYYYSDLQKNTELYFYFVSDQYLSSLSVSDKKISLIEIVRNLITNLQNNGFLASDKKTYFTDYDITRIDRKIQEQ